MLSKKTISFLLKCGISLFALLFLLRQLTDKSTLIQFSDSSFINQLYENWHMIILVFFMMFVNWFLESLKWRFLIRKIESISIPDALRAIFSGITVSAFTPNRIGEYGGRVFCLEEADRIQGVLITVIGSISQLLTTIVFGLIGFSLIPDFLADFSHILHSIHISQTVFILVVFFLNITLVALFLNISFLSDFLLNIKFLEKYEMYNKVFSFYTKRELLIVLFFSILRYMIFSAQFFILLICFGVDISLYESIVLIPIMFFIISIIPSIAITEIGVRGSVAIFLFSLVSINKAGILYATFLLWLINLLIPSLIGIIFIFTLKFFRK